MDDLQLPSLSRRGLLGMFATGIAAAIVRPGIIMPIKPKLVMPDGIALLNIAYPIPEYRWFLTVGDGFRREVKLFTRHKWEPKWRETVDMPFGVEDIRAGYASRGL